MLSRPVPRGFSYGLERDVGTNRIFEIPMFPLPPSDRRGRVLAVTIAVWSIRHLVFFSPEGIISTHKIITMGIGNRNATISKPIERRS